MHLFALHYAYLPCINGALRYFVESWNSHPLTSANCQTPLQLWFRGMIDNINSGFKATEDFFSSIVELSLFHNWDGLFSVDSERVEVEQLSYSLSHEEIRSQIQPLHDSDSWGVDIYNYGNSIVCCIFACLAASYGIRLYSS